MKGLLERGHIIWLLALPPEPNSAAVVMVQLVRDPGVLRVTVRSPPQPAHGGPQVLVTLMWQPGLTPAEPQELRPV